MRSSLVKSTLREIRGSLGRYLAIIIITALGVGFFSGLKVTRSQMLETADRYVGEAALFDFRLLSTLGYTGEEVEKLAGLEGIEAAEGSYSADAVFTVDGTDRVLKAHSITEKVNRLKVVAGRLPESSDECVLDSERYDESDIGKTITTESEGFAHREYTVCGIVSSACYLNFERGNTNLGDGTISAFLYLPIDGFDTEVYTEVYLTLKQKAYLLSEEYDELIDSMEQAVGDRNEAVSVERFEALKEEAGQSLEEARQELMAGWEEYRSAADATIGEFIGRLGFLADLSDELKDKSPTECLNAFDGAISEKLRESEAALAAMESHGITSGAEHEALAAAISGLETALTQCREAEIQFTGSEEKLKSAEEEVREAERQIDAMAEPTVYLFTRDENVGYSCFSSDSRIVDGIAKVFPIFFFLVAALVCTTTMTRMVDEERVQIGTLKALGYGSGAVTGKYLFYSGSAALIGCAFGFAVGTYLFPAAIWKAYDMLYGFAPIVYVFDWALAGISFAAAMLCSVGSTLVSCRKELTRRPAELVRPKAPKPGKRILLERITPVWKRLSFLRKVSLRNIFRYKRRLFMMILGIGGCSALVLTGFGIRDSIANIANLQFDHITVYDYVVSFENNMTEEEQAAFIEENRGKLSSCAFVYQGSGDLIGKSGVKSVNVVAAATDGIDEFIKLHSGKTEIPVPKKGEVVVDRKTAEVLRISKGDKVTIRDIDYREIELTVSGICDNYVSNYAYLSYDSVEQLGYEVRTAYAFAEEGADLHGVSAAMMGQEGVVNVSVNADIRERVDNMMTSLNAIVWLVIGCAGALAFVVLFNLSNINITERIREIATIKVLGFYPSESCAYVFRENLILTAIGAAFGIPLGIWLHRFVISCIKIDMVSFETVIAPLSYLLAIAMTFLFAFLVELVMRRKINGINMAESLKSAE